MATAASWAVSMNPAATNGVIAVWDSWLMCATIGAGISSTRSGTPRATASRLRRRFERSVTKTFCMVSSPSGRPFSTSESRVETIPLAPMCLRNSSAPRSCARPGLLSTLTKTVLPDLRRAGTICGSCPTDIDARMHTDAGASANCRSSCGPTTDAMTGTSARAAESRGSSTARGRWLGFMTYLVAGRESFSSAERCRSRWEVPACQG